MTTRIWAIRGMNRILQLVESHEPPKLPDFWNPDTCSVMPLDEIPDHEVEAYYNYLNGVTRRSDR